jgi:hypothetical protein
MDQHRGPHEARKSDDADADLDPREAARDRRRDHDLGAEHRDLMRPGMGKVFRQILDRRVRDADAAPPKRRRRA